MVWMVLNHEMGLSRGEDDTFHRGKWIVGEDG